MTMSRMPNTLAPDPDFAQPDGQAPQRTTRAPATGYFFPPTSFDGHRSGGNRRDASLSSKPISWRALYELVAGVNADLAAHEAGSAGKSGIASLLVAALLIVLAASARPLLGAPAPDLPSPPETSLMTYAYDTLADLPAVFARIADRM